MNPDQTIAHGGAAEIQRLMQGVRARGRRDTYDGKRARRRIRDGLQLEITADPTTARDARVVPMHDISETGVALWSRSALPVRSVIYLREYSDHGNHPWLRARVKRCDRGIRGFFVGCVFEQPEPAPATAAAGGRAEMPASPRWTPPGSPRLPGNAERPGHPGTAAARGNEPGNTPGRITEPKPLWPVIPGRGRRSAGR